MAELGEKQFSLRKDLSIEVYIWVLVEVYREVERGEPNSVQWATDWVFRKLGLDQSHYESFQANYQEAEKKLRVGLSNEQFTIQREEFLREFRQRGLFGRNADIGAVLRYVGIDPLTLLPPDIEFAARRNALEQLKAQEEQFASKLRVLESEWRRLQTKNDMPEENN